MSDIVAELDDLAEFRHELAMQIKKGNALHPDDVSGERWYAIGVIDTLRRMERHVLSAYQLALEIALREEEMHPETWLVVPDDHAMQIRLKLKMREQS